MFGTVWSRTKTYLGLDDLSDQRDDPPTAARLAIVAVAVVVGFVLFGLASRVIGEPARSWFLIGVVAIVLVACRWGRSRPS